MTLNDRKIKILQAIINDYVVSAEPVGSRTIAKNYNLGISSATIRNEMSDLEDMGLIIQPHASAGRIPSDKGYRLYVDELMNYPELKNDEMLFLQKMIDSNINQIHYLMEQTAKAISFMTSYTTIVTESRTKQTSIKTLQIIPVDEKTAAIVIVTDSHSIKNGILDLKIPYPLEVLSKITASLNAALNGQTLALAQSICKAKMESEMPQFKDILEQILNFICDTLIAEDNAHIYMSGAKNILAFPEFSDIEKAKEIFQALEEKEMLITIMGQDRTDNIQVVIGGENGISEMKNCSLVKAHYKLGGDILGSIGVIGPTRMDYGQTMSVLNGIAKHINKAIKALSGG